MFKYFFSVALLGCTALFAQSKQPVVAGGKQLYTQYCLACHQENGAGVPNLNPPLIKTSYVSGDKTKLISWVLKGSGEEKIPIDGSYYNNNMPPQAGLKDEEIAKILTYIRSSFGNKASAIAPAEVKAVRAAVK